MADAPDGAVGAVGFGFFTVVVAVFTVIVAEVALVELPAVVALYVPERRDLSSAHAPLVLT